MATTFTLKTSSYDGRYLQLTCSQTPDITNNTSTIKWTLSAIGGSVNFYSTGPTTVKINNEQVYYKARVANSSGSFPAAKGSTSGSIVVNHNNDGSLTIPVSLSTAIFDNATRSASGNWTLDKNARGASITSAPNFTDEGNPVIQYSNPVGTAATTLQACITDTTGTTIYAPYRDISKTGTSYTFNLTDAERNALRNATPNSNTMSVTFYIKTITNGNTFYSSVVKTLTIANPNPICNPTVKDIGSNSITYTGDAANKVIKGFNTMSITFGASAVKGATIKSKKVVCGGMSLTADGSLYNVESGDFVFTITDSRGNTTTKTIKKTLIDYFKPTCSIGDISMNAEGAMSFSISGKAFNGSFGAVNNSLTVKYRYRTESSSYGNWNTISVNRNGNNYSITGSITGLNYRENYWFQAMVIDTIYQNGIEAPEKMVFSYPLFDWNNENFNFNVPVQMNGQTVLRHNATANNLVVSSSGGFIYFRPGGTDARDVEILMTPQGNIQMNGDILINGKSLLTALRNAGISI